MKWYIALNETSLSSHRALWEPMITAAVKSARKYTSLEPYLIYDGKEDPFFNQLRAWGMTIKKHRVSFYSILAKHSSENPDYLRFASGAFLRVELPLVESEDEYILYTDCDILFQHEVDLSTIRPKFFACAPEFNKDKLELFNTGVMVMNVPKLRADLPKFTDFITKNLDSFETFDQDAYRIFYKNKVEPLPLRFNWKPYWGVSKKATIVHFHGPKPSWAIHLLKQPEDMSNPDLHGIFHWDIKGYEYFVPRWQRFSGESLLSRLYLLANIKVKKLTKKLNPKKVGNSS